MTLPASVLRTKYKGDLFDQPQVDFCSGLEWWGHTEVHAKVPIMEGTRSTFALYRSSVMQPAILPLVSGCP